MSSLKSTMFGALAMTAFIAADNGGVRAQTPRPPEAVGDSAAPAAADRAPDATAPAVPAPPPGSAAAGTPAGTGAAGNTAQKHLVKQNTPGKVTVQFTYDSRILVPHGADLKVTIQGTPPQTLKTKHDGPPYTAILKVRPDATFPLKASAVLASSIGHQFAADFEIKQENLNGTPLDVTLNAK